MEKAVVKVERSATAADDRWRYDIGCNVVGSSGLSGLPISSFAECPDDRGRIVCPCLETR